MARDAVFEVVAGPGTEVALLNPIPAHLDQAILRVPLGDLAADQEVRLMLAVRIGPCPQGESAVAVCRVHDRDGVLPSMPMQVDWTAVSPDENRQQPVNRTLLLEVARMVAEAARLEALDANRRGQFTAAREAIHAAADRIAGLDSDDPDITRVAAELRMDEHAFVQHMAPLEAKSRRYLAYQRACSREDGKARRRPRPVP